MAENPESLKLFKLVNGDEIIAEVIKYDDIFIHINWPIQVVPYQGDGYSFGLTQWIEHIDNQNIKLSIHSIMAESEPLEELKIARENMITTCVINKNQSGAEVDEATFASMEPVNIIKTKKSEDDLLVESIVLESGEQYFNEESAIVEEPKYLKF